MADIAGLRIVSAMASLSVSLAYNFSNASATISVIPIIENNHMEMRILSLLKIILPSNPDLANKRLAIRMHLLPLNQLHLPPLYNDAYIRLLKLVEHFLILKYRIR